MPLTSREKARKHAKYVHHCSCGATPSGNGGKAAHKAMHARRMDGHSYMTSTSWYMREAALKALVETWPDGEWARGSLSSPRDLSGRIDGVQVYLWIDSAPAWYCMARQQGRAPIYGFDYDKNARQAVTAVRHALGELT